MLLYFRESQINLDKNIFTTDFDGSSSNSEGGQLILPDINYSDGYIILDSPTSIDAGETDHSNLIILSNSSVTISGSSKISKSIIFSEQSIYLNGGVRFEGILFSLENVTLSDRARCEGRSLVVVPHNKDLKKSNNPEIVVQDDAISSGYLIVFRNKVDGYINNSHNTGSVALEANNPHSGGVVCDGIFETMANINGFVYAEKIIDISGGTRTRNSLRNIQVDRSTISRRTLTPFPLALVDSSLHYLSYVSNFSHTD